MKSWGWESCATSTNAGLEDWGAAPEVGADRDVSALGSRGPRSAPEVAGTVEASVGTKVVGMQFWLQCKCQHGGRSFEIMYDAAVIHSC
jgi:hypothetical protein